LTECTISMERCGGLCTGFQGQEAWRNRRKAIDKDITCETCNDKAHKLETFDHDFVNARLGKQIHDVKNWDEHIKLITCANNSCKKEGRC